MTLAPDHRPLLPMAGQTHGRRSAVTCHLRCGDACSSTPPNTSHNDYFRDVVSSALSRRAVLGGMAASATVAALAPGLDAPAAAAPSGSAGVRMPFTPIAPVTSAVDDMTVPTGYTWKPVIRWGDPILPGAPLFDPENQSPSAQAGQFGYNCDYLDIIETNRSGTRALLVANHEYTNENIMSRPTSTPRRRSARPGPHTGCPSWSSSGPSAG